MDKPIVKELIQDEMNAKNIKVALKNIITDGAERTKMQDDFAQLKKILNVGSSASQNAATIVLKTAHNKQN